jgi:hypothetical protein
VELLRQFLGQQETSIPAATRARALARLAEAMWSLGAKDSARASLREVVQVDPFYTPPADQFNPELQAAYTQVRRQMPVIAIRAPRDTVLTPFRDTLPIEIAVGQAGEVRILLRLTNPRRRDSLLTALSVDSVSIARIALAAPNGGVLAPGSYVIEGEVAVAGRGASDLMQLMIERLPVDTTPHEPSIAGAANRPATRKRGPSLRTMGEGIGLGALAIFVSAAVNDGSLSGRAIPSSAWLVGGSVALANVAFKRPSVPVPENIRYNESLRSQLEAQNRTIAAENATRLRLAPLRIRATREP